MEEIHEASNIAGHGVIEGALEVVRFGHASRLYQAVVRTVCGLGVGSGVDSGKGGRGTPVLRRYPSHQGSPVVGAWVGSLGRPGSGCVICWAKRAVPGAG